MNNQTTVGLVIDMIGNRSHKWSGTVAQRLAAVRKQADERKYVDIHVEVERRIMDAFLTRGVTFNARRTRTAAIVEAKGVVFLTTNLATVNNDVRMCLHNNVVVSVFHPFLTPDMMAPTSIGAWEEIYKANQKDWRTKRNIAKFNSNVDELQTDINTLLDVKITWLNAKELTLRELLIGPFKGDFDKFMEFVQGRVTSYKEAGEYDTETFASYVVNPKAEIYRYEDKEGLPQVGFNDEEQVWENYIPMPADILREFLSLSYYKAKDYKPLNRVVVGDEGEYELFNQHYVGGEELALTPLYVDPNLGDHEEDLVCTSEVDPEVYDVVYNKIGLETIKRLGYEEALKAIRYNLNHN